MPCGDSHAAMVCWADLRLRPWGELHWSNRLGGHTLARRRQAGGRIQFLTACCLLGLLRPKYLRGLSAFGGHLTAIPDQHGRRCHPTWSQQRNRLSSQSQTPCWRYHRTVGSRGPEVVRDGLHGGAPQICGRRRTPNGCLATGGCDNMHTRGEGANKES